MNERLPYEQQLQQQWIDLPLPDENLAWADMKRRLEEDDDDKLIVWWRRGCTLWGLLLLVLITAGLWLWQPQLFNITSRSTVTKKIIPGNNNHNPGNQKHDSVAIIETGRKNNDTAAKTNDTSNDEMDNTFPASGELTVSKEATSTVNNTNARVSNSRISTNVSAPGNRAGVQRNPAQVSLSTEPANRERKPAPGKNGIINPVDSITQSRTGNPLEAAGSNPPVQVTDTDSSSRQLRVNVDSTSKSKSTDSLSKTKTPAKDPPSSAVKKDSTKNRTHFFSAGIAEHQQLPVNGQKATPYNSLGRKGTIADYIPSVYFRFNETGRWFVQAEFRYGAPQYTKPFVYKETKAQSGQSIDSSAYQLQKTYYHQLPVTFNYYVLKNWSLGAGITWNRFSSAVSQVELHRLNVFNQSDSLLGTEIINDKHDSSFVKSYFQGVLESHFQWKRFSLGARYSFGLQPYIKFSLPGGIRKEEKNSALQVFLRYDLWRSKEK